MTITDLNDTERIPVLLSKINNDNLSVAQRFSRWWMALCLGVSDSLALFAAGLLAVGLRMYLGTLVDPPFYWSLTPLIIAFLAVFAWWGLYPAVGLSPVEELRRLTVSTSVVYLIITAFTFWVRTAEYYSRLIFAFAWFFSLILLPLARFTLRNILIRFDRWGEPVAVIGYGAQGKRIVDFLLNNLRFGLRPVVVFDGFDSSENQAAPIPMFHLAGHPNGIEQLKIPNIQTVVLITSEMPTDLQDVIVEQQRFGLKRLILIPNLHWVGSVGVVPYDLEGFLGLEVRQNLLNEWEQALKRVMDLITVLVAGIFSLPLFCLLALLIKLDSRGRILYKQRRIGKNGGKFDMWKFRTMVRGADQVLEEHLANSRTAREEWLLTQKLRHDPRVTRVGKFLRKTSLDELPQLWNVLRGEMSLVGPRPIVEEEIKMYQEGYRLYRQVRPGITGLWQVSGRNDVGYEQRVRFDEYYVRNWSIWLDIYILIRTVWSVLKREGAY
jgi:Undecaprenyl-phosphate galactose phosphotransferase WbaP